MQEFGERKLKKVVDFWIKRTIIVLKIEKRKLIMSIERAYFYFSESAVSGQSAIALY